MSNLSVCNRCDKAPSFKYCPFDNHLDRITKGRAILGIGAGEAQNVVDFGIDFSKPVSKFKEQLEVIESFLNRNLTTV